MECVVKTGGEEERSNGRTLLDNIDFVIAAEEHRTHLNMLMPAGSISTFRQQPECEIRLFCFPYGGAAGSVYRSWAAAVPQEIQVCAANFPGDGAAGSESPYPSVAEFVDAIIPAIRPLLGRPFAFFGHSIGSLVAFELACRLHADYDLSPAHLFVSGYQAPQLPYTRPLLHALPEAEFIQKLKLLNGTPHEVWQCPDLVKRLLPLLRRDFCAGETYHYVQRPPLLCPISAFGGTEDTEAFEAELKAWGANSLDTFLLRMFPGDHFFIHSAQDLLLDEIANALRCPAGRLQEGAPHSPLSCEVKV